MLIKLSKFDHRTYVFSITRIYIFQTGFWLLYCAYRWRTMHSQSYILKRLSFAESNVHRNDQLTHLSLASLLWDIGKQHSPTGRRRKRRPIWGYPVCLEKFHRKFEYFFKITPEAPQNENVLTQMIMTGESIRQIWVKQTIIVLTLIYHSYYIFMGCRFIIYSLFLDIHN